MIKLTGIQEEFILNYFFKNEKYLGRRNIGEKLLQNGFCIVAGDKYIWHGGIGNFIYTKDAKDSIGCLEYTFKLDEFLSSPWFKQTYEGYLVILNIELKALQDKINDLENLKQ